MNDTPENPADRSPRPDGEPVTPVESDSTSGRPHTAADGVTTPENASPPAAAPSAYAPPTGPTQPNYAPPAPTQNHYANGAPQQSGYPFAPPAAAARAEHARQNPGTSYPSAPQPSSQGAFGQPASGSQPAAGPSRSRRGVVPIIAALAVGALVGGVSGAAVAGATISANESGQSTSAANPANITVNDAADATAITAVAAAAGPSVVTISVSDGGSQSGGTGSGVILSEDGYVLTNSHVVTLDGASASPTVSVQTADGRLIQAEVVGTDPISDLAVLKMDGDGFQPIEFADSDQLNVGDTAVAIGAPLGLANTVTNGIVSSLNRSITVASSAAPESPEDSAPEPGESPFDFWQFGQEGQPQTQATSTIALSVIQTDAAINPGNSGGALLDDEGRLIGVNVAIASAGQGQSQSAAGSIGVGFAIPSNLAERIAGELVENGAGSHGLLGANVTDVTADDATVVGALIQDVEAGSAADQAGLESGDVVTRVGDVPVTSRTDLTAQIRALAGGAETTLTFVRDGGSETVDVTLGTLGSE